jgi:hypothetical protein
MEPPRAEDNDSANPTKDELVAHVIPLRHRAQQRQEPQPEKPPPPQEHSIWEPQTGQPALRRRSAPTPAASAAMPSSAVAANRPRARAITTALLGAAAIVMMAFVLLDVVPSPGRSAPPKSRGSLAAGASGANANASGTPERTGESPTGAPRTTSGRSAAPRHRTSKRRPPASHGAPSATPTTGAAPPGAPASDNAPLQPHSKAAACEAQGGCAAIEFGFER